MVQIQMIAKLLGYKEVTSEFVAQKGGPSLKQLMENYKMCWYRFVLSIKVMHCNQPIHATKFDKLSSKESNLVLIVQFMAKYSVVQIARVPIQ